MDHDDGRVDARGYVWGKGYTQDQLDDVQAKWDLRFPPDLLGLLRDRRLVSLHGRPTVDWVRDEDTVIRGWLDWPFEGFRHDVESGGLWWPEWGARPETAGDRHARLQAVFAAAPTLIPVFAHRFLPSDPCEAGNSVFSVWQSDVIVCGADLADYLEREASARPERRPWPERIRRVPFWTEAVERNSRPSRPEQG